MGNGMAAAVKHFSFAHLRPGPRTADYSVRVLDCLCFMLGVSGYKGLMLRVQGHPLLTTGFKLSEKGRTIASNVAEFLQSRLPPMSSVVAGFARGAVVHPGYLMHPRVLLALMSGLSETQCLRVRNLSPGPAPGPSSEASQGLAAESPARPEPHRQSPPRGSPGDSGQDALSLAPYLHPPVPRGRCRGRGCSRAALPVPGPEPHHEAGDSDSPPRGTRQSWPVPPPWKRFLPSAVPHHHDVRTLLVPNLPPSVSCG
jgi:hypothetical protein